jgi:hypothetical protein
MWTSEKSRVSVTFLLFSLVTVQLVTGCADSARTRSVSEAFPPFTMVIPDHGISQYHDETKIEVYRLIIEPSSVTCSGKHTCRNTATAPIPRN